MDKERALTILDALASGVDPESGEVLPPASVAQRPEVIHALLVAADALRAPAPQLRRAQPGKAGMAWTGEEDRELAEGFDAGRSERELAEIHQRSLTAIRARLARLGKIDAAAIPPRFRPGQATSAPNRDA